MHRERRIWPTRHEAIEREVMAPLGREWVLGYDFESMAAELIEDLSPLSIHGHGWAIREHVDFWEFASRFEDHGWA